METDRAAGNGPFVGFFQHGWNFQELARDSPISGDDHWLGFTAPPATIEHSIGEEFFRAMLI
jgi:hypothetical protein